MIIDFHTHTFPAKIAAGAIHKMQGDCHAVAFTAGTAEALQHSMQQAEITCSVVLPVATNPLKVSSINDLSMQLTEKDGLIYFGCIHPEMEDPCAELDRIAASGLKGIKIHPVYQDVDIDDPRFLRILDRAGQLGLIVVMHAGDDIGFPGVVRCSPAMIKNALQQVGPLTLVAAHMGGWKNWPQAVEQLADTSVYIDTAFSLGTITPLESDYYTPEQLQMLTAEQFCRMVHAFGSERILFGTDSPWSDQTQSKNDILALPLTEHERNNIFYKNAKRLLKL